MTTDQVNQMRVRHRKWMLGDQQDEDVRDEALNAYSSDTDMLIRFALSVLNPGQAQPPTAAPIVETPATAEQREEIMRLLNHPVITRGEKTKMLLHINNLKAGRAHEAIQRLHAAIEDRSVGADLSTKAVYAP